MHGVALLLLAAAMAHVVARALRVPAIPLLLLSGLGLSVVAPPPPGILEDALLLGVAILLFVFGLELDPRRMRAQRRAALQVGVIQFIVLAGLGFAAALALGLDRMSSAYVALALTASSTLVGVRLLQRRRQMFEPFGRLVLGVLLVQDVLVLLSIPIVTELPDGWLAVLVGLGGISLLGAMSLLGRRWLAPLLLRTSVDREAVLLGSLAVLFVFLAAADFLGLPIVVGAFLGGVSLARFPTSGVVRTELRPVGHFFSAIFFTALGGLVGIPDVETVLMAAVLVLVLVGATPPVVAVVAERAGFSARTSIEAGLLLSQASEISLVIGLIGMVQGVIAAEVFTLIALVTMATMLLTPLVATDRVTWRLVHLHPGRRIPPGPAPSDHVLLLGAGSTGMPILEDLIIAGADVMVVDDDPAVLDRLEGSGVRTLRGDASDRAILLRAGADRARLVCSTIRRAEDNVAVLDVAADRPVLVRVFDESDARWVEERGGVPVIYSVATADGLMEWFREETETLEESLKMRTGVET